MPTPSPLDAAAAALRATMQPLLIPVARPARARRAPVRSAALLSPVAPVSPVPARTKPARNGGRVMPPRPARPDRSTVRSVAVVGDTVVVTLAGGTNARIRGLKLLADVMTKGADGFPVRVIQHRRVVADTPVLATTSATPINTLGG